jgi:hypothetical protein
VYSVAQSSYQRPSTPGSIAGFTARHERPPSLDIT